MSLIDIILLAVALAMDCLTVSIVSGVIEVKSEEVKDEKWWIIRMAFLFGLFQAMMPLIGWLGISHFQSQKVAHAVAVGHSHEHRRTGRRHLICLHRLYSRRTTHATINNNRCGILPFQPHRLSVRGPLRTQHRSKAEAGTVWRYYPDWHRREDTGRALT